MNLASLLLALLRKGDVSSATRLYEDGGSSIAEQLLSELQRGDAELRKSAVAMYAQARDFGRAARLHESARFWPDAARMYEEADDLEAAARCWKKAGEPKRAARALHAAGAVDEAAELYAEPAARATALAGGSRWLESAAAYRQAGNARAEADVLRQIPLEHKDRVPAVKRLAEILLLRNRTNEAAQLIADVLRDNEAGRSDLDLHELLAALFDKLGQNGHAERLRLRAGRLRARLEPAAAESVPEAAAPAEPEDDGYQTLKQIPIFAQLTLGDMRDLHRLASEETWSPGEQIVEAGVDAPGLFILLEGDAEVYAVSAAGARHLNSLGPGAHVGEISLLSKSLTSARVTASTQVRGLRIARDQFELYLESHPAAALRIYRLFGEGLAERVRALSAP